MHISRIAAIVVVSILTTIGLTAKAQELSEAEYAQLLNHPANWGNANARVVLDFEPPLPAGLAAPTSWTYMEPAPASAIISDHYAAQGILISGAAIQELGTFDASGRNAAPSGTHTITGVNSQGKWDWATPLVFTFVSTDNMNTPAATTYFSITPDRSNDSDNAAVVLAFDISGNLLGSVSYREHRSFMPVKPLVLNNIGLIHKVVVVETIHDLKGGWGGIAFDLVTFAPTSPIPGLARGNLQIPQVNIPIENTSHFTQKVPPSVNPEQVTTGSSL